MKAKELMIGDRIRQNESGLLLQVSNIQPPYITAVGEDGQFHENSIEPIPLNHETLEANGFMKKENHTGGHYVVFLFNSPLYVEKSIGDQWEVNIYQNGKIEMYIQYVHELQHILRVQGCRGYADNFIVKKGGAQ